jgi:hypothetical protein
MRRMCEDKLILGPFTHMSNMWNDTLLRQLAESARQQTCAHHWTSGDRISAARRALVVLLYG